MTAPHASRVQTNLFWFALALTAICPPSLLRGQTAPAPTAAPAPASATKSETVQLNPFEVKADADESYGALQSNSLTAFGIDLEKMPATAQVFTRTFMDDVAATSLQEVLANYSGTVFDDALSAPGDRYGIDGSVNIRGLPGSTPKRDGLVGGKVTVRSATGYTDTFSTERVELVQGPQSLLYGAAGGGGIINQVSKRGHFNQKKGSLQLRLDQYGGKRAVFDYNYGTDRFALRLSSVGDRKRDVRYNMGGELYGIYGQAAYRILPQTTVRVFHERIVNWSMVAGYPGSGDLFNFMYQKDAAGNIVRNAAGIPAVNTSDPRRAQTDVRYLALTGQLADLRGVLWSNPVDYFHLGSFATWFKSEKIANSYSGATVESTLPWGFALNVTAVYSETVDNRFTTGTNLVPAAGYTGASGNPFPVTAVRVSPGDNLQTDRTRDYGATLVREDRFHIGKLAVRSQTAVRGEYLHQGPAFGSSGFDRLYYRADANWNTLYTHANGTTDTTIDYARPDYGRVALSAVFFPVQEGLPLKPLYTPGASRITYGGQNYVLDRRIFMDPARATPQNPLGLIPNNPTAANPNGFAGNANRGQEAHSRLASIANYTSWMDGRVTTIAGASVNSFEIMNTGPGTVSVLPRSTFWGTQFGINVGVWRGVRAYANVGTSSNNPASTKRDLYGESLGVPKAQSPAPEIGIKYYTPDGRVTVQLAHNLATTIVNDQRNVGADPLNAVNPTGINGRFNAGDSWVRVDRESSSTELTIAANPTRHWRMRLQAVNLEGRIKTDVSYPQLYNDQFHANAAGVVTYANGTPLLVDPAGGSGAKNTPLTLTMINTVGNPYYAAPEPISGSITGTLLRNTLTAIDPTLGAAATGVAGLPISARQYNWTSPSGGEIVVVRSGDKTTGINEYTFNFQNNYSFSEGPLKGLGVFSDLRTYYHNRAYYTQFFPAGTTNTLRATRVLYRLPVATVVNLGLSYRFKLPKALGGRSWSTRLNVNNALNHYRVWVLPNASNGANLQARLSAQPRQFIWTNTVDF